MSTPHASAELSWFGERCLRIEFTGDAESSLWRVHAAFAEVASIRRTGLVGLLDATPAYRTLLLTFDPMRMDAVAVERAIREVLESLGASPAALRSSRTVAIPACYDAAVAPDLEVIARAHGVGIEQISRLHASPVYTVAFVGFSPGFPYLTGLSPDLHTPRHSQPRTRVAAGSIGIAGDQTGIYPQESPGGWRIIGRTPLALFDAHRDPPTLLAPGDRVRFEPIDLDEFNRLASRTRGGT